MNCESTKCLFSSWLLVNLAEHDLKICDGFQYTIDYSSFNSVYKVDTPTESAKELEDKKKAMLKMKKKKKKLAVSAAASASTKKSQTDDESGSDVNKNVRKKIDAGDKNDVRLFGGSTPSLMVSPQPYPFYYHPYIYPRQLSPTSTLSTPLLWPPQPPPQNPASSTPTRYSNRRRPPTAEGSSQDPPSFPFKAARDDTEEHYWLV